MATYAFEGMKPVIGAGCFIHPSADVIGNVTLGDNCFIGPGARIRGDYGTIVLGDETAVEDNVVIHARPGEKTTIGSHVTLGHGCVIHNCTIHDWAVIGMGSVVSDYVTVGVWGVVGEGAVVKSKDIVPDETVVVGVPAKPRMTINDEYKKTWTHFKSIYVDLASKRYPEGLELLD